MDKRITEEIELLKKYYKNTSYKEEGQWVAIKDYPLPAGFPWNRAITDICFQIPVPYPGSPPYGFYVPAGILYKGSRPGSYTEPANSSPPFQGTWGFFSWAKDNSWFATDSVSSGSNLLTFVWTFTDRFSEGV